MVFFCQLPFIEFNYEYEQLDDGILTCIINVALQGLSNHQKHFPDMMTVSSFSLHMLLFLHSVNAVAVTNLCSGGKDCALMRRR